MSRSAAALTTQGCMRSGPETERGEMASLLQRGLGLSDACIDAVEAGRQARFRRFDLFQQARLVVVALR